MSEDVRGSSLASLSGGANVGVGFAAAAPPNAEAGGALPKAEGGGGAPELILIKSTNEIQSLLLE